jgi:hypothetical protein
MQRCTACCPSLFVSVLSEKVSKWQNYPTIRLNDSSSSKKIIVFNKAMKGLMGYLCCGMLQVLANL